MVVGPGAIGCLFGAHLVRAGQDVVLLDHRVERAAAIARRGLRIVEADREWTVPVRATCEASAAGNADLVCVCVKACDTRAAAASLAASLGSATPVLSIQNGLDNGDLLAARLAPGAPVLCCATAQGGYGTDVPGVVHHAGHGPTRVGPRLPRDARYATRAAAVLRAAGIDATAARDTAAMLWRKLVLNAAINPVTALWDLRNGELPAHAEAFDTARRAAAEAAAVARAEGVALRYGDIAAALKRVCRATAGNLSSMLQDVRRGRRTEIGAINGAVVARARRAGLDAPVNAMLVGRVRAIAGGR